jgi:hypothetical protein
VFYNQSQKQVLFKPCVSNCAQFTGRYHAAKLEFASPRGTFQPITALKFLPDSSDDL